MDKFQMALVVAALFLIFILKGVYDKIAYKKKLRQKLETRFGQLPENSYDAERYKYIGYYFEHKDHKNDVIDKITWNDLDMELIFMMMNQTCSGIGEEYLYSLLHEPLFDDRERTERKQRIEYYEKHKENREQTQMQLMQLGKMRKYSMYQYIDLLRNAKSHKPYLNLFLCGCMILSIVLSISVSPSFIGAVFVMMAVNIIFYYKYDNRIYFESFGYAANLSKCAVRLSRMKLPVEKEQTEAFKKSAAKLEKLGKRAWMFRQGSAVGGTLTDLIMDYVKMIFHVDLIMFDMTLASMKKNDEALRLVMDTLGEIDACIAIASFRAMKEDYCCPEFTEKVILKAEGLYHPLIQSPVKNDIKALRGVLLTGSNASGKSTFLKTVAINAIFAQTICTVLAQSWTSSAFRVYSSMALKDNIVENESYFIVEIKSLKRIISRCSEDIPMLCFIDEVLRGTNTVERIAASSQILFRISQANTLCFAATHDIELTSVLEPYFDNYHFQEEVSDGQVTFDYRLRKGRAVSRNAIRLLGMIGFGEEIVEAAGRAGERFEKEGIWSL